MSSAAYRVRGPARAGQRLSRRRLLAAGVATVGAALFPGWPVRAAEPYPGPLVDAHSHLKQSVGVSIDALIGLYDAVNIRGAVLFGEPWQIATDARARYPGRVAPFLGEGYSDALHPDSSYVHPDGLEQLLSGRFVVGLGEVILRHSPYRLGAVGGFASAPGNSVPADHSALLTAYRLAGRYSAPVTVHQEWFYADELERTLRAVPETTFVWAHAGHGDAATTRRLLERNPNLLADLSARTPWIGPGTVLLRADGTVAPDWFSLLHDHGDRFLFGLDLFAPAHFDPGYVRLLTDYNRGLLGQLDPGVAALIGHGNAERLVGL